MRKEALFGGRTVFFPFYEKYTLWGGASCSFPDACKNRIVTTYLSRLGSKITFLFYPRDGYN
jgi:hypothetical protein